MGNFYLIQRGSFKDLKKKDYTALTGRNGLIDLDYMGYAEFEYGAIPASYTRIMHDRDQYIFRYLNDVKNADGKILVIFCNKNNADAIEQEMRTYLKEKYKCKAFTRLPDQLKEVSTMNDFWWSVENKDVYSDWMCWFGMDKLTPFKNMIDYDHENFWLKSLSQEEREDRYNKAIHETF